jgi:hypothetical protein
MLRPAADAWRSQEKIIAEAVRDVASEIRLIDLTDLVCYFRIDRIRPVEALINCAIELYFKPGSLVFARSGSAYVGWSGKSSLNLDFELRHEGLNIFFSMLMHAESAAIQINFQSVDGVSNPAASDSLTERTAATLSALRTRPASNQLAWWHPPSEADAAARPVALANFLT